MKYKIIGACIIYLVSLTTKPYRSENITKGDFYYVVYRFIGSIIRSDHEQIDEVLYKNSGFKIPRPDQVLIFGKLTVLDDIKDKKERKRYFEPGYGLRTKSHVIAILQIDLRYGNIIKQILLSL